MEDYRQKKRKINGKNRIQIGHKMKKSSILAPFWPLSWKPQVLSQISCRKYKVSKKKKKPTINQTFKNFGCWLHCMLKIATSITKSLRQFYKELKEENVIKTGWKINTSQKTRKHPFWHLGGKPLFLQMEDDNKSLT